MSILVLTSSLIKGISKGIRTIEINKQKKAKNKSDKNLKDEVKQKPVNKDRVLYYILIVLTAAILTVILTAYVINKDREESKIRNNRFKILSNHKTFQILSRDGRALEPILEVQFGQGIPKGLKSAKCTCSIYLKESQRYDTSHDEEESKHCLTCLDWAYRSNLRVLLEGGDGLDEALCYNVKWQSYDSLLTPLVDCFNLNDEQWFGLGDVQHSLWPLDKMLFEWTPLTTNFSFEYPANKTHSPNQLALGSFVDHVLMSTKGIYIGRIKTDFDLSLKIETQTSSSVRRACISVSCTEKCSQTWSTPDEVGRLRYKNNMLEYSICSYPSLRAIISHQVKEKSQALFAQTQRKLNQSRTSPQNVTVTTSFSQTNLIERELDDGGTRAFQKYTEPDASNDTSVSLPQDTPGSIGLIERTIFATSLEFMPVLDGQTLRLFVDSIVQLGLKTSSILLIDSRWETYAGSLKLNIALFPKSKLLFEILHNKGFKIVLKLKPYIDSGIGMSSINQLLQAGRLYSKKVGNEQRNEGNDSKVDYIYRRRSLFTYDKQMIDIINNRSAEFPYLFRCKESQEEYCALIDLTQLSNRNWLTNNIKRSNLLTQEVDGIQIGGSIPISADWIGHYRQGVSELSKSLFYKEKIYTLPQWSGEFGHIQLAPRDCSWNSLRSLINSVLNLGMLGFSLVHPGSVWGDLKSANSSSESLKPINRIDIYGDAQNEKEEAELMIRWLQVSVFLPILQFNNIAPIERYNLQEQLQNLVRIRKLHIVPELKRHLPYTPLVDQSRFQPTGSHLPLIRPVWYNYDNNDQIITEQFLVGSEILVAPILSASLRQRDIYLPTGFWRDELRQVNLRGGKWLRNYPVELNEIAWFTKAKR